MAVLVIRARKLPNVKRIHVVLLLLILACNVREPVFAVLALDVILTVSCPMRRHPLRSSDLRLCITAQPHLRQRPLDQGTLLPKKRHFIFSTCLVTGWPSLCCSFQISEASTRRACGEIGEPLTPLDLSGSGPERGRKPKAEGVCLWFDARGSHVERI